MKRHNGSLELMIMLAIMRLDDAAYGVPISREIESPPAARWRWPRSTPHSIGSRHAGW